MEPRNLRIEKLQNGQFRTTETDAPAVIHDSGVPAGGVTAVTGTAPIASSGGATPDITIAPATTLAPGSMSAADKVKVNAAITGTALGTGVLPVSTGASSLAASNVEYDGTSRQLRIDDSIMVESAGTPVASASTITLGGASVGNLWELTGLNTVDRMSRVVNGLSILNGTRIDLYIPAGLTITHVSGTGTSTLLDFQFSDGANFVSANDTILGFRRYNSRWVEVGR